MKRKLTDEQVREIKRSSKLYRELSAEYHISVTQISLIKTGARYAKIKT